MKFSYTLIKELVPGLPSKDKVADALTMKAFEAELVSGDTLGVEIPHNRYADGASHIGVARECSVIFGKELKEPEMKRVFLGDRKTVGGLTVKIEDTKLCPRYGAAYFELGKKGATPVWMKKILQSCGLRPIHPVVDILNYVMLEIGQPLHAFDANKLHGGIVVRSAKKGEKLTTIDGQNLTLDKDVLVIADEKKAQAVAGIKGGKPSEVNGKTKRIIVEAANFDAVSVYKASRKLDLVTDASARFAHGMSPHSVELGMDRVRVLLEEIVNAKFVESIDVYPKKQTKEIIGFNIERFNSIAGTELKESEILKYLTSLGFKRMPGKGKFDFLIEVPPLRIDVTIFEDLVEEVVRLYGINDLKPVAPMVTLSQAKEEEVIALKDKVRNILIAAGFSEIYGYSYNDVRAKTSYELENPISENKKYLRQDLSQGLNDSLKKNSRFFEDIRVFEIGNVFDKELGERLFLGLAIHKSSSDPFIDLKGTAEKMLHKLGIVEFVFVPAGIDLEVRVGRSVLGIVRILSNESALAELDLGMLTELVEGEYEFQEIPKYPAVMRDISVQMETVTRVGEILNAIEGAGAKYVQDVDLIDYYNPKMFTFRIIFQSKDRTLKDKEVNGELDKITANLKKKFRLVIR